ncbi:helix-turn-helix domain-containing protein [Lysobacter sp. FW306-1B-D06B]|uniref:helix-turn-helix domain-containing protein n=1 Tax=Lysobacter sp. FW306-1B-D06B TaxID=3140250 RepID=UPI003140939E
MTSLANLLKSEITRLARKEIRTQVEPLRKANAKHRHEIAALRRQITEQQSLIGTLRRSTGKAPVRSDATEPSTARFSAKGLKSLRAKLGLSAADFGHLAGVSGQSIYHWESGKTVPRAGQLTKLVGLRSLGKRAAQAQLEAMSTPATKRTKHK